MPPWLILGPTFKRLQQGGNRDAAPTRPDIEMGLTQPAQENSDKHMEEFFKEVSLIKVGFRSRDNLQRRQSANR